MRLRPTAIVTDIEGTTTPIAFVRDVLFPYARARLPAFLAEHGADPVVAEAATLAGGRPVLEALLGWMDADAKVTPLKAIQGLIWDEGYARGELLGRIYPDVPPVLRRWRAQGIRLYVYSSGSEAAQRLIFGHSDAGDLGALFSGFFDTRVGAKREAASYASIARGIGLPPGEILFLSDIEAELDAAAESGVATCQLVRAEDGTVASVRHAVAADFGGVQARLG
jgi:enolase-phosphatase E1